MGFPTAPGLCAQELSTIALEETAGTGLIAPDDGTLAVVVAKFAGLVMGGELSMASVRTVAVRACFSAAMHKAVGVSGASVAGAGWQMAASDLAQSVCTCAQQVADLV
jgi:hypothetical protein